MKYIFQPFTSNNSNIDIVVFKNESPIVHFSFDYNPYIALIIKKTWHVYLTFDCGNGLSTNSIVSCSASGDPI